MQITLDRPLIDCPTCGDLHYAPYCADSRHCNNCHELVVVSCRCSYSDSLKKGN